ncbi:unnamed protein product [Rotaria sp. Silwood1]|nr:unnamed protein product [Rotaria sp. Silwood1]CAF1566712.1 unnamed protein product [Rotaria sp. Silwood1]
MSDSSETKQECCLNPLDSARFIMKRARHVSINHAMLEKFSNMVCSALMSGKYANNIASDPNIGPTKEDDKFIIDWTFLIDTLNFSFWTDDKENESYVRKYKDKIYCGSFALAVSINQALDVNN